ncbi:hypothetical protein KR222_001737, partial [Zaprionus bogoriensis]
AAADYVIKTTEDLATYRNECAKELLVPDELLEQYRNFEYEEDAKAYCYLKCALTKLDLFDSEKGFNVANTLIQLTHGNPDQAPSTLKTEIMKCFDQNEQGSNACEWAYRGATCLLHNNLDLIKRSLTP